MTTTALPTSQVTALPVFPDGNLLTHSGETCFKTCQRKYYHRYAMGLVSVHDANPLRLGTAFHLGLEGFKNRQPIEAAEKTIRDSYADTDCPPWLDAFDFAVECETATAMVKGYYARYWDDAILEFVAVEISFDVPIINPETGRETPTYRSAGKIDGIAKLPDGRLAIVEHKTTSESVENGSDYWGRLLMDGQISRYVLAARHMGYDVETTVFDVVRKPGIKPKLIAKADRAQATANGHYFEHKLTDMCPERETPQMYGARLLADMKERPDFYFARNEIARLDADLQEFQRESWVIQREIRTAAIHSRTWGSSAYPRNTSACLSMGKCQYFNICRGLGGPEGEIPEGFKIAETLHGELRPAKQCGVHE